MPNLKRNNPKTTNLGEVKLENIKPGENGNIDDFFEIISKGGNSISYTQTANVLRSINFLIPSTCEKFPLQRFPFLNQKFIAEHICAYVSIPFRQAVTSND